MIEVRQRRQWQQQQQQHQRYCKVRREGWKRSGNIVSSGSNHSNSCVVEFFLFFHEKEREISIQNWATNIQNIHSRFVTVRSLLFPFFGFQINVTFSHKYQQLQRFVIFSRKTLQRERGSSHTQMQTCIYMISRTYMTRDSTKLAIQWQKQIITWKIKFKILKN